MGIQEDATNMFNWTSEKVEACDNGTLCQETILLIKTGKMRKGQLGWWGQGTGGDDYVHYVKTVPPSPGQTVASPPTFFPSCLTAGTKTAILATKSCSLDGTPAITFIQHTAAPSLAAISYSNYCEDPFCNNREGLYDIWNIQETEEGTLRGKRWVLRETLYTPEKKTGGFLLCVLTWFRFKWAIHKRTSDLLLVSLFLNCHLGVL